MIAEVLLARRAQQLKILWRHDEYRQLYDGVWPKAVCRETRAKIRERQLGLLRERGWNRAVGAHADLPGHEDELGARRHDGRVRIRADRGVNVARIQKRRHFVLTHSAAAARSHCWPSNGVTTISASVMASKQRALTL